MKPLELVAPVFGIMRGAGGAIAKFGSIGQIASQGAGKIFQLEIAGSTLPLLIDGAKYGMSIREVQQLITNIGFITMPVAIKRSIPKKPSTKNAKPKIYLRNAVKNPILNPKSNELRATPPYNSLKPELKQMDKRGNISDFNIEIGRAHV